MTLHTQTTGPSLLASTIAAGSAAVLATNLMVAADLWLTFALAYVLAFTLTRNTIAALLAALIFGWSPYVGAHLQGHFNLIAAWALPLTALLAIRTLESRDRVTPLLFGLTMAFLPYVDDYYLIYGLALVAVLLISRSMSFRRRGPASVSRPLAKPALDALGALLAIASSAALLIWLTGGTTLHLAGRTISMRRPDNLITASAAIATAVVLLIVVTRMESGLNAATARADLRRLAVPAVVAVVATVPLAMRAVGLWANGDYVTQRYFWKSAPSGVDASTLLLGNPYGWLTTHAVLGWYARLHLDRIEQVAWIGPGVLGLWVAALLLRRGDRSVRQWTWVLCVFLAWALGPFLMLFGRNTHVMLPQTVMRFIPIVANARIPGRAMSLAYLALALLAAIGFDALWQQRRRILAIVLVGTVVLDYAPAAVATYRVDHPRIYDVLRTQPSGAVIELPLGLRDGFGEVGRFDSRVLLYQTIHEHPIAGGFVARLAPRLIAAYQAAPVLGSLLRLSAGTPGEEPAIAPADAGLALHRLGFEFVVVNEAAASPDLVRYVQSCLPLERIASGDGRTLYRID